MSIDKETVKKIGNLAKIELSAKEIDIYSSQLTKIIDFMNKLDEVDTTKTKTFSNENLDDHTGRPDDSVEDGNYVDKIIKMLLNQKKVFLPL